MPETIFHCESAWLGGGDVIEHVEVGVTNERISSVRHNQPASAGAISLEGLTLPGLANAHSHAFHRALRGRTHIGTSSFWTWRDEMYRLAASLDPDSYHQLARATFAEMALAGVTAVGEFHYLHHGSNGVTYAEPNAMAEAVVAAAHEAGIRITLLDTCYLHGGFGSELSDVQRRFSDGTASRWCERVETLTSLASTTVNIGAAIHSVRAVDRASIGIVADFASTHGMPLHAHVSEQPSENEQCLAVLGMTPTELLSEQRALGSQFTAVHATHLTNADIALLGDGRCTVCMCPTTERDLADGIGHASALHSAGSPLSLGSDSHAIIDMFEEARAVELDERLDTLNRGGLSSVALLQAATSNGQASIGWNDAGRIEVGALADLVSVRLDSVRTAGTTIEHALSAAVFAATASDVHHVVASGVVIVDGHLHTKLDVAAELSRAIGKVWS